MKKNCIIAFLTVLSITACYGNKPHKPLIGGIQGAYQSEVSESTDSDDTDSYYKKKKNKNYNEGYSVKQDLENLLPKINKDVQSQILYRTGYITSYNKDTKLPNWTMWHLTKAHSTGNSQRKNAKFHDDYDVPSPRATNNDYYNSRYDRGHMCPAGDNKWSSDAMNDCFLFTNMCPQNHNLNTGAWNDLEMQCRYWARRYGDIYIVCGPLLDDGDHKKVGRNKVVVPERFYKVVLRLGNDPAAIGFIYENKGSERGIKQYACSVDDVEEITGIDFFSGLSDGLENKLESKYDTYDWVWNDLRY